MNWRLITPLTTNYEIIVFVKAKRTLDFRWKKPSEVKTRLYQNITVDFKHILAYYNNKPSYMALQSSILGDCKLITLLQTKH